MWGVVRDLTCLANVQPRDYLLSPQKTFKTST